MDHVVDHADGWIPIGGAGSAGRSPSCAGGSTDAGRDPEGLRIVPFGSQPTVGKVTHFRSIGVTEVVCRIPSVDRGRALRALDEIVQVWDSAGLNPQPSPWLHRG